MIPNPFPMGNEPKPDYNVSDFRDVPNFWERMSNNLLVPIGITLTVGCYFVGLKSMAHGQYKMGQRMMFSRVIFQGITMAAMFYDQFSAIDCNRTTRGIN